MILFTVDFGVGSRLKNDLIATLGKPEEQKSLIIKGVVTNCFVSVTLLLIAFIGIIISRSFTDYSISSSDKLVSTLSIVIAIVFVLLFSPLRVLNPLLQSQQKNALSGFILITPQLYILAYLFLIESPMFEDIFFELVLFLCIATLFTYLFLIFIHCKKLNLRWSNIGPLSPLAKASVEYGKKSLGFFLAQISIIFLFNSNEVFYYIIGAVDDIVHYQYYYRIFSIIFVGFAAVSMPFWSAIRESYVSSDNANVKKLFFILSLLLIPISIVVLILGYNYQTVIDLWLGEGHYVADNELVFSFAVFSIFMCIMYACSAILNSFDVIKYQAITLFFACIIKFICIFIMMDLTIDPVVTSSVIALIFVVICFMFKAIGLIRSI
ncbi:hypothetical protein CXF82_09890 [Shewanella sp. GutDb-MelDb]|nr:hypothetical protein CXF82_09890 [Shewanella sp. GutDb-MelDb]